MNIKNNNISVIVQGMIDKKYTKDCLQSIRKQLPGSTIILSTWENSDVSDLDFDKIIFSKDPGGYYCDKSSKTPNNINRQIVSTRAGIPLVKTEYCLKFRTDIMLNDNSFLNYFGKYDTISEPLHVKNRILICNYHTCNPRVQPLPFHPSDWVFFGRTEDIKKYFALELQTKADFTWFDTRKKNNRLIFPEYNAKYVPEQYLYIKFLENFEKLDVKAYYDASNKNIQLTEEYFAKDFVILDYGKEFNIEFKKYNPKGDLLFIRLMSYEAWQILFKRYCLNQKNINWIKFIVFSNIKKWLYYLRLALVKILAVLGIKDFIKDFIR